MELSEVMVHSDGGARGNPGPGACAFVIDVEGKEIIKESRYLGRVTNNFAEYSGVVSALDWLLENQNVVGGRDITFYLDSELVVRQLTGLYKVKNAILKKIFEDVRNKINKLGVKIFFQNVPRSKNKTADFLVNQELDKNV